MVLDGDDGVVPVGEALDGFVIEVEVADLQGWGQTVGVQGVTVVLGGDVDASGDEVFDQGGSRLDGRT